ncbi:myb-related protein 1 isoform X2 [Raphanus sativus]|uniref:Myb-related protein 1 isoform X2 n=1 Tax=Raphanus sativus TaxID=3726 RepID=A0A6J0K8T0_RAPSA|nr:myb-related protein 1 isoform X2 [Raphanus sativus]
MYYHNQHQGKSILSSSRMPIPTERHPFLRGNGPGDSGLILSTDAKPRLKWTPDLHERFVEAVNQLGGGEKATPKTIMKVMGIPGLTLYHLKSHLQKYRLSKNLNGQANSSLNKTSVMTMVEENTPEADESQSESLSIGPQPSMNLPISDALQMQIAVQRRLHEQLERHLQLRIEAQGKYLQAILEKAQETLGRQNLGPAGIEATKAQLSELVSKVSSEYPDASFLELQNLHHQQMQTAYPPPNSSLESCLTSSEGTQKAAPKMLENRLGLRTYLGDSTSEQKEIMEEPFFHRMELTWAEEEEGLRENNGTYLSTMEQRSSSSRRSPGRLSIGVGLQEHRGGGYTEERFNENGEDCKVETQARTDLDLNTHDDETYITRRPKQFDLNGFSWS